MSKKELYELARQRHKAALRACHEALDRQACAAEIARLRFDAERASLERQRAFEEYMDSD